MHAVFGGLNWKVDRQQRVKKKFIKTREIASWPYQETKDKAKKLRRDTNAPKQSTGQDYGYGDICTNL